MSDKHNNTSHIITSLMANVAITIAKGVAAVFTRSGSMLAEALHSLADCANQVLLLIGVRRAQKPPDKQHPLGYGRSMYFWSFMVALLLFSGGGMFSIREGFHKLEHPEPVEHVMLGIGIMVFAILLDGYALLGNISALNKRKGETPFFQYLSKSKDSDLVVLFAENGADVIGLMIGIAALTMALITENPLWDSLGSLAIGAVLVGISLFLAKEIHALLLGEAAEGHIEHAVQEIAKDHPHIKKAFDVISLQQGPGEVLVAMKLELDPELTTNKIYDVINEFESKLREKCPEAKWIFAEPDLEASAAPAPKAPAAAH